MGNVRVSPGRKLHTDSFRETHFVSRLGLIPTNPISVQLLGYAYHNMTNATRRLTIGFCAFH